MILINIKGQLIRRLKRNQHVLVEKKEQLVKLNLNASKISDCVGIAEIEQHIKCLEEEICFLNSLLKI